VTTFLQYFIDAVTLGCFFALAALGVGIVFGVMRLANFAHGELIMIGSYVMYFLVFLPWPIAWTADLAIVALVAVFTERVAFRWLRRADPTTLLIASFAVSIFLQNVIVLIYGSRARAVPLPPFVNKSVTILGLQIPVVSLMTIVITVVVLVVLVTFFRRTNLGLQMRAAAEDFRMAQLVGARANRVVAAAFAISGAMACLVSFLLTSRTSTITPTMGLTPVLYAFVAVTIGGLGNLVGSAVGGFVVGFITVAMQAALPPSMSAYRDAFTFTAVIAILIFRPGGLISAVTVEERV
jgi:branched-chain amino acid transport system permease protein